MSTLSTDGAIKKEMLRTVACFSTHQMRAPKTGFHRITDLTGARRRPRNAPISPYRRELRSAQSHVRVVASVLCYSGKSGPRKVRAADQHLIGNHPIEQLAAGGLCQLAILVESAVPLRMPGAQRRHVSGIVGNHQLRVPGG